MQRTGYMLLGVMQHQLTHYVACPASTSRTVREQLTPILGARLTIRRYLFT